MIKNLKAIQMKKIITNIILLSTVGIFAQQQTNFDFSKYKEELPFEYTATGMTSNYEGAAARIHAFDTKDPGGWVFMASDTIKNGTFTIKGTTKAPQNALLSIMDDEEPLFLLYLIAEPETVSMTWDATYEMLMIEGGNYNEKVVAKSEQNPKILNRRRAYLDAEYRMQYEQDTVKLYAYNDIIENYIGLIQTNLDSIRKNDKDPMARLLAMQQSSMFDEIYQGLGNEVNEEILSLEQEIGLGEIPIIAILKNSVKSVMKDLEIRQELQVGNKIKDFTSRTIDQKEVTLLSEVEKSSYVLLDFWASWCGPCREENPNMKKVYNSYKDRVFNIVAFSIDDEKKDWEAASTEDDIPWINLSDT